MAEYEDTGLTPQEIYSLKAGTIIKAIGRAWIPVDERLPEAEEYVLVSFENFSLVMVGRFDVDKDGAGTFMVWDEDESFLQHDLFVNAWMLLPEQYKDE